MGWTISAEGAEYRAAEDFLRTRAALELPLLYGLVPGRSIVGWWDGGGVFVYKRPDPVLVGAMHAAAAAALAEHLPGLPGGPAAWTGRRGPAEALAAAWSEVHGRPVQLRGRQALYRLAELLPRP